MTRLLLSALTISLNLFAPAAWADQTAALTEEDRRSLCLSRNGTLHEIQWISEAIEEQLIAIQGIQDSIADGPLVGLVRNVEEDLNMESGLVDHLRHDFERKTGDLCDAEIPDVAQGLPRFCHASQDLMTAAFREAAVLEAMYSDYIIMSMLADDALGEDPTWNELHGLIFHAGDMAYDQGSYLRDASAKLGIGSQAFCRFSS